MNSAFFSIAGLCPLALLLVGGSHLLRGIVRQDNERTQKSLYFFLVGSILALFFFVIRYGMGIAGLEIAQGLDLTVFWMAAVTLLVSALGISYYHIHRLMPEFFVRSASVCSVAMLLLLAVNALPSRTSAKAGAESPHRFQEAQQYQHQKSVQDAGFASNP